MNSHQHPRPYLLILLLTAFLTFGSQVFAQDVTKILAVDGAAADQFGWSVLLRGDRAFIGAPGACAVYYYALTDGVWHYVSTIRPEIAPAHGFGWSLSMYGDHLIVGSPFEATDTVYDLESQGAAYLFEYNQGEWHEVARLTAREGTLRGQFGWSVSVFGERALVGAPGNGYGGDPGHAYLFEREQGLWVEKKKLAADDPGAQDQFGNAVALSDERAFVGAPRNTNHGMGSGAVYLFEPKSGQWRQTAKLKLPLTNGGARDALFGWDVSVHEDRALISTLQGETSYVFEYNHGKWEQQSSLGKSTQSVVLLDELALVGTQLFTYSGSTWSLSAELGAADTQVLDLFGRASDLDGEHAIVGAAWDDDLGANAGSAYIFSLTPEGTFSQPDSPAALVRTPSTEMSGRLPRVSNYPNPYTRSTYIHFTLEESAYVRLVVYDMAGRVVQSLVDEIRDAGDHHLEFDATGLPGGVYYYSLETPSYRVGRTMIVTR